MVKDPQSGFTKELLQALESNYEQSTAHDENASQLILQHWSIAAEDTDFTENNKIFKKAKEFLSSCTDLMARGCRSIGK